MQLGQGLAFLHGDVRLVHGNLCPETVLISRSGAWKIFGLDFCVRGAEGEAGTAGGPCTWPCAEPAPPGCPPAARPSPAYQAPELAQAQLCSPAADMFSLGALAYALHASGNEPPAAAQALDARRRAHALRQLTPAQLACVPEGLRDTVKLALNTTPELRPDAHQFIKVNTRQLLFVQLFTVFFT